MQRSGGQIIRVRVAVRCCSRQATHRQPILRASMLLARRPLAASGSVVISLTSSGELPDPKLSCKLT